MAKQFRFTQLMNTASAAATYSDSVKDMAGSADIGKREIKVICSASGVTYNAASAAYVSFPIVIEECATTNGTFTTVGGDSGPTWTTEGTTGTSKEIHIQPKYRYLRARIGTLGTAGGTGNFGVFAVDQKRA